MNILRTHGAESELVPFELFIRNRVFSKALFCAKGFIYELYWVEGV